MHSQGMARANASNWDYQYNLTDHLGNVRSVASSSNAVLQRTDYFPFGLAHGTGNLDKNKYLYNGKELQTELGYDVLDYGARVYDPRIIQWNRIDRFSEKYFSLSPYSYGANNPILNTDINGDYLEVTVKNDEAWLLFQRQIREGLAGQYRVYNAKTLGDNKYIVKITKIDESSDHSLLNDQQKEFYNALEKITNDENVTTKIGLVKDTKDVTIGKYDSGDIDMGDVVKFDVPEGSTNVGVTSQGKLIHEMHEQYERARYGERPGMRMYYGDAHKAGIHVENMVNGTTRGEESNGRYYYTISYKEKNGSITSVSYTKRTSLMQIQRQIYK